MLMAVTVPPEIVICTGTGFGFGAATVDAASVIAEVNISGALVTTVLAESRSAPASTKWDAPPKVMVKGARAYLFAMATVLLSQNKPGPDCCQRPLPKRLPA